MARSRRTWGWHELDPRWARRLVAEARLDSRDLVLDVGAGRGAVTSALTETGARVIAIELHPGRLRALRARYGDSVRIVRADAADLRLPKQAFHVVANPPFTTSGKLVSRLVAPGSRLVTAHVVLQQQVAKRWASARAPGWHRWTRLFEASLGPVIPRYAFRPPPRVNARVLHIRRRA